jgi:hypothetical protein
VQLAINGLANKICGRDIVAPVKEKARGWALFSRR